MTEPLLEIERFDTGERHLCINSTIFHDGFYCVNCGIKDFFKFIRKCKRGKKSLIYDDK